MEFAARRPNVSAGLAVAAAGVIAAGPIAQHLPDLHLSQRLSAVSVSDVQLTDAAGSVVDLFSGVESELASLASGGVAAAAAPAGFLGDFSTPVQTWVSALVNAGTNLQYIFNTWSTLPFPVVQQVAANGVQYASDYFGAFQAATSGALHYFFGIGPATSTTPFVPLLQSAWSSALSGNMTTAVTDVFDAVYLNPVLIVLQPLEAILKIPADITQNLANAMNYLTGPFLTSFGADALLTLPVMIPNSLGPSLQAVYDAWAAGDQVGALTNLINTPGAVANAFLNGISTHPGTLPPTNGLLSSPAFFFHTIKGNGLVNDLLNTLIPNLANQIVAPGAQNIAQGGSLATAVQNLASQLIGSASLPGLPALGSSLANLGSELTSVLESTASSVASGLGSLGSMAGAFASQIGTLLINLLKLL